jgi:hypothetical protein
MIMMIISLPSEIKHVWNVKTEALLLIMGGSWKSLKIIQKINAPITGNAQNQGTANNSLIVH